MSELSTAVLATVEEQVRFVGQWLSHVPTPAECLALSLEVRPTVDGVVARCSAVGADGGESVPWMFAPEHPVAVALTTLQTAMALPGEGTWLAARFDIVGEALHVGVDADRLPAELVPGRAITADELRAHLRVFPRDGLADWMLDLLARPEDVRPC